jgi:hypothetical protein
MSCPAIIFSHHLSHGHVATDFELRQSTMFMRVLELHFFGRRESHHAMRTAFGEEKSSSSFGMGFSDPNKWYSCVQYL